MSAIGGLRSVPMAEPVLGEIAKPPFAVLPNPSTLFQGRSRRLAALAPGHQLEPYLRFLAHLTLAQHDVAIAAGLPPAHLPPADVVARALDHRMPPLARAHFDPDAGAMAAIESLLDRLAGLDVATTTAAIIASLRAGSASERHRKAHETLMETEPCADLAQHA